MPGWNSVGRLCGCRVLSSLSSVLSSGGPLWPCKPFDLGFFGVDNLNVVRSIGRLLDNGGFSTPLPLVKDGDLIAVVQHLILARDADTVKATKGTLWCFILWEVMIFLSNGRGTGCSFKKVVRPRDHADRPISISSQKELKFGKDVSL